MIQKLGSQATAMIGLLFAAIVLLCPSLALAATGQASEEYFTTLTCFGIRWEIIIFIITLVGIAVFYKNTTDVAIIGTASLVLFKLWFDPSFTLQTLSSPAYIDQYLGLINLAGMLFGFGILADCFEKSNLPSRIPKIIPNNFLGGVLLLLLIFVISTFLDNIAAAMIGFAIAYTIYDKKVHIGYIAAIVAASNAGGAGSVVGDTTTTIMWIAGKDPLEIIYAFIPALISLFIFSFIASKQQQKWSPMSLSGHSTEKIDWIKLGLVLFILVLCIWANTVFHFPALGIWIAIYIGHFFTKLDWKINSNSISSTIFLLVLVFSANLIPIGNLPEPSTLSTFSLGLVSSVFNNIPLTQLCLEQGGYNWSLLSFAVGFGGSMIWFGSSAGVAVCDMEPKARSMVTWVKCGWHVILAYIIAFWVYAGLTQLF